MSRSPWMVERSPAGHTWIAIPWRRLHCGNVKRNDINNEHDCQGCQAHPGWKHWMDRGTYVLELPVSCFISWQYISSRSSPWRSPSLRTHLFSSRIGPLGFTRDVVEADALVELVRDALSGWRRTPTARSFSRSPIMCWITLKIFTAFLWSVRLRTSRGDVSGACRRATLVPERFAHGNNIKPFAKSSFVGQGSFSWRWSHSCGWRSTVLRIQIPKRAGCLKPERPGRLGAL